MFENILGNQSIKEKLENIILTGKIPHSYIFSGPEGIGKLLFAKDFAKALLCLDKELVPCNNCRACISFENCNNPDLTIIDEQESSIKTEQIKALVTNILEKPILSRHKIIIINNSENMTKEAQNSLLKTLEEPPYYAIIVLITKNENLLLNTIKSRCIKIQFGKLNDFEMQQYFKEEINSNMYKIFDGSIGRALNLKNQIDTFSKIDKLLNNLEEMNELQTLKLKEELFFSKDEIYSILDYMNTIFSNKSVNNLQNSKIYYECIKIIENTKLRLKANSNYDMTIDNLLISLCEILRKE